MPKDKNNNQAMTKDEKFRSFFSTTAVNIPDEMTRRDEELPEEKPQKRFGLFARGKADQEEAQAAEPQEMPTGEVVLGGDAQPEQEADLELMLKPAADPEQELAPWPLLEMKRRMQNRSGWISRPLLLQRSRSRPDRARPRWQSLPGSAVRQNPPAAPRMHRRCFCRRRNRSSRKWLSSRP